MINNIDVVKNKLFPSAHDKAVIARVTVCLAPHHKCTGRYADFSGSFSIICDCLCHTKKSRVKA